MTCIDPAIGKLLGSYELGLLTREEKTELELHLLACDACFREHGEMSPVTTQLRDVVGRRRSRFWRSVAAAAAIVVVGVLALRTLGPDTAPEPSRGHASTKLVVLAPMGSVTTPERFDWKIVPEAEAYELRLRSQTGDVIWEDRVTQPPARLPDPQRDALRPGAAYFWEVEAIAADGRRWRSGPIRFLVLD